MAWRGTRKQPDPLLTSSYWRVTVRNHFKRLRLPCAVCRVVIDYSGPRYLAVRGRRRLNPRGLVVGHIVSRYEAKRRGWTDEQINALSNLRPECQDCSNRSGARLGQKIKAAQAARQARSKPHATANRW